MVSSVRTSEEREFAFTDRDFKFLSQLAYQQTGIVLAEHKRDMVYGRLVRRLRSLKLPSFAAYCDVVQKDASGDEMIHLINAITTNLTGFFREGHHFEHLRDTVLKPLVQAGTPQRLRIWSSAASSGMEPYSLAMVMRGTIPDIKRWDALILATDIDSNMLDKGRKGEYEAEQFDNIPREYQKFATVSEKTRTMQMSGELKTSIRFNHLNLLDRWPMQGPFDVIFCRNVVIYFDKPTKVKLFERMAEMLTPNGWLYIGHSENLHGISNRFELIGRTIYRRVK